MPRQTQFPKWWIDLPIGKRLREQLRAHFTITRDGYARWYKGRTVSVCGKGTAPDDVEDRWQQKQKEIDAERPTTRRLDFRSYRDVLSEFLTIQQGRVGAQRHAITERTLHNYTVNLNAFGNFRFQGLKIADCDIKQIGPEHFTAYAVTFNGWKASGFDSVVTLVGSLFRWAVGMEYIARYRPGPEFRRPAKKQIRSERIALQKSFTPAQVAKAHHASNHTIRCWIALGICAAFNNSDINHLTRSVIDLSTGMIDYRRRKTGKIRRVIPLPADVIQLLSDYRRPDPADPINGDLFFLTIEGLPYSRTKSRDGNWSPSCSISRLFGEILNDTKISTEGDGKNFSGLRTTHYNIGIRLIGYDMERKIVMGRAQGDIDLDHYLEEIGLERLRHYVNHVWNQVKAEIDKISTSPADSVSPGGSGVPVASLPHQPPCSRDN